MTIAAAEAAPAIAGEATGATADAAAGGRGLRPSRGKAPRRSAPAEKPSGRGLRPSGGTPEADAPSGPSRRERAQQFGKEHVPRGKIERNNYQAIILMEFVGAVLLTAATPIATKKDKQGLSPYAGKDIVKLSAITITYLILAMISVGGRTPGRFAAWFGGLILLADGLYEASNIVRDLQVFSGAGASAPASGAPAPGPGGILPTPSGTQPVLGEVPSG